MEPRIQYAKTSDGVSIAYAVSGEGTPLVFAPAKPFSHVVLGYEWGRELWKELEQQFRVLRYDVRGSGMSDRSAVDFSLEAAQRDLEAVVCTSSATLGLFLSFSNGHSARRSAPYRPDGIPVSPVVCAA